MELLWILIFGYVNDRIGFRAGDFQAAEKEGGGGMIVVSDTTPLISLLKIDCIDLLEKLFEQILISQAVFDELTANERFKLEADQISRKLKTYKEKELTADAVRGCIEDLQNAGRYISQNRLFRFGNRKTASHTIMPRRYKILRN